MPTILGIESTAHTFGIGIVKNGKVLSNVREMYTTESGGIIPMESAKHHSKIADEVFEKSLKEAEVKENEIDAIAFSQGPGLAPCLLEGMKFAKKISKELKVLLVPVNHCVAHLEIGKIVGSKDAVMLYVSGANTQIIAYESGKYRIFGETLDLGVGNFIDTIARFMDLGFPGGPKIEKLAKRGKYLELPYKVKGMDVALSGIQTKVRQMLDSKKYSKKDLAYSVQETVFAMLVETAERALAHTGKKELLLGGGVACNSRLQEMCRIMCKERGAKLFVPEKSLLVDNGAMIAFLGEIMFRRIVPQNTPDQLATSLKSRAKKVREIARPPRRKINNKILDILPRQRTDDVSVDWK